MNILATVFNALNASVSGKIRVRVWTEGDVGAAKETLVVGNVPGTKLRVGAAAGSIEIFVDG